MSDRQRDSEFMAIALKQAQLGMSQGGLPIGAVLVRRGEVIATGFNKRVQENNPILHGEMDCIRNAGRQKSYKDMTLYTTLSPCLMCAGTIVQMKIPRVVIGENRNFGGNEGFLRSHGIEILILDDPACVALMERFINEHLDLWNEDVAEE